MSGVKWGKTWRLYQKVTYHYRRSARPPSAHCMAYGLHRGGAARRSPSASSCAPPTSHESGCVRSGKRCRTPMPWWCTASQSWIGFIPFMSRATRACTRSFPRSGHETAICAIPPCDGMNAAVRSSARTATRSSKWTSARTGRTTPYRPISSSFKGSIRKTMFVLNAALRYGRRSIRTDGWNGSKSANTDGYTAMALKLISSVRKTRTFATSSRRSRRIRTVTIRFAAHSGVIR